MSARRFSSRRVEGGRSASNYQITVAYDGIKTEDEYFRGWQLLLGESRLNIDPFYVTSGGNPLKAVEACSKILKKNRDSAEFWCVTDVDDTDDAIVKAALELAGRLGVRLCVSRRCFEVWMALHYERCSRPVLSESDAVELVAAHIPKYSARDKSAHFDDLWRRTNIAIDNADWLLKQGLENPSTRVHGLVRKLRDNLSDKAKALLLP